MSRSNLANVRRSDTGIRELMENSSARIRRTETEILEAVRRRPLEEAAYLMRRLRLLEAKMVDLLNQGTPEAAQMILQEAPYMRRYYHHH